MVLNSLNIKGPQNVLKKIKKSHCFVRQYKQQPRYSKRCVKGPLSKRPKMVFKTDYRLIQVKSIAECSHWSILHYIRPSFSYHLSFRPLFCVILSGRFIQVSLYD